MASGGIKVTRDLVVGDCVLNNLGGSIHAETTEYSIGEG